MCLTAKKKGSLQEVTEVSDKDILVWKQLYFGEGGRPITPHRSFYVEQPWLETNEFSYLGTGAGHLKIYQGIHSYQNLPYLLRNDDYIPSTIPAGTPFIRGEDGDIVSLFLLLGRW